MLFLSFFHRVLLKQVSWWFALINTCVLWMRTRLCSCCCIFSVVLDFLLSSWFAYVNTIKGLLPLWRLNRKYFTDVHATHWGSILRLSGSSHLSANCQKGLCRLQWSSSFIKMLYIVWPGSINWMPCHVRVKWVSRTACLKVSHSRLYSDFTGVNVSGQKVKTSPKMCVKQSYLWHHERSFIKTGWGQSEFG